MAFSRSAKGGELGVPVPLQGDSPKAKQYLN